MTSVICDLDGVIYRGDQAVPGSPDALRRLRSAGVRVVFVTNNATRTPEASATKIERVTGVEVDPEEVCTSAVASASVLTERDSPVLVVGEEGICDAISAVGLEMTDDAGKARSVVVGLYRDIGYQDIADAADAVRSGARFIATNTDPTFPTADGVKPGAGAIVAAIATVAGSEPEVCGKPHAPMRALIRARGVDDAWVIGDRAETDIALAIHERDWRSILVLSGVTDPGDPNGGADHVVADFAEAVDLVLLGDERR